MLQAMSLILISLLAGFTLKSIGRWKSNSAKILNEYVIDIALPCLILTSLPKFLREQGLSSNDISLALAPWILFLLAVIYFLILFKLKLITKSQLGLLVAAGGFGNTAFVGFPMLEGLMGKDIIPLAIILDQFGTFLCLTLLGIIWITWLSAGKRPDIRIILTRLVKFPPFLALCLSFVLSMTEIPSVLAMTFERLGQTLVPVAMFNVGLQLDLNVNFLKYEWKPLVLGMLFKLLIAPLVFLFIYSQFFSVSGKILELVVLEMSMAPMITSTVLAMEANLEPRLGALCLGLGIPFSLMTVPLVQQWLF